MDNGTFGWHNYFNDRQINEIEFNRVYDEKFGHGTSGHNERLLIARMATIIERLTQTLSKDEVHLALAEFFTPITTNNKKGALK